MVPPRNDNELDLDLKLKIMRYFWYNGYFVRKNVDLAMYQYGERTSDNYTDIDVLALKFDEKFKKYEIICDCKSGRRVKNVDRILWLNGLINYLDADEGIFFRNQINERKYLDLAKKLNITPLSKQRLSEFESKNDITEMPCVGPFNINILEKEDSIFQKLKESFRDVHDYLKYGYWNDGFQRQIKLLTSSLKKIMDFDEFNHQERYFLQIYILALLSISFLKFAESLIIIPQSFEEEYIQETILGEEIEINERKEILGSVYDYFVNVSSEVREAFPNKNDFLKLIYIDFTKYLIDLIQRMSSNPLQSRQIPRFLDIMAYELVLNNDKTNVREKLFSNNNNIDLENLAKLVKNVVVFALRANLITEQDASVLNSFILDLLPPKEL